MHTLAQKSARLAQMECNIQSCSAVAGSEKGYNIVDGLADPAHSLGNF